MRAVFVAVLLAALPAGAQRIRLTGGGAATGGVCTLDGTADAIAVRYRATATTGTGFQVDAVLDCGFDTGPGTRNCIGTNAVGDILLGPGSGNSTVVRAFGDVNAIQVFGSNITAATAFILTNNAFLTNSTAAKAVLVTDVDGFQINGTTALKGWVQAAVTVDFASIGNNACATQSVTVTGAAVGDAAWGNADFALPLGVSVGNVRVTATNTVELTLCNVTAGGALDPSSGSFIFRLSR